MMVLCDLEFKRQILDESHGFRFTFHPGGKKIKLGFEENILVE